MIPFRFHRKDGSSSIAARVFGTVGMLLVALLVYLSVDPEAHERIHHDADGADHHCVITAFAAGEALLLSPALTIKPAGATIAHWHWRAGETLRAVSDRALAPSCGPPSGQTSV